MLRECISYCNVITLSPTHLIHVSILHVTVIYVVIVVQYMGIDKTEVHQVKECSFPPFHPPMKEKAIV